MPISIEELRSYLHNFDFRGLFVEGLGWNHYQTDPFYIQLDGREYILKPVAEKAGFVVYQCESDDDVPQYSIRRKIESQVAKRTFEHLIVFVDPSLNVQVWQWVKREPGKAAACREISFSVGQGGDHLLHRLQTLFISLDDELTVNISLVTARVRAAFDSEKVTNRFYERFQKELQAFAGFIAGIATREDRDWYASLMLNRMMFIYFVQKKSFLNGDVDYLRNKLREVQRQHGGGRFHQFYRLFLIRLFLEGLGQPEPKRAPDLAELLGRVPFLNGGLFDVHDLERDNPEISIPDDAFERVFDFFDEYRWHLDERPYREDNEINPDVLGYIFEKFVNQKQMGAYYTKEDITGYISRNTVIPFLFDAASKACPVAFEQDGSVWRLLHDDPDRYIYPAVGHGITWNAREIANPTRLDSPFELPYEIADGIEDVSKRVGWNRSAPDDYALPTETWREVLVRRNRFVEIRTRLASGEVQDINELVTLNLDIEQFARDVIAQSEGPELLHAFWHAMRDVSVLDPTCGSGAFLFAALNVLEPLYTACLEGMRGFLDDLERSDRPHSQNALSDFKDILDQVDKHPSERYFILKSIVLNNLYGVDIMEEAVEICKLRLFLKLVAQLESYGQIEPLPDIDFNVRAGNTLVGFTSLDSVRGSMTMMPDGQHRQVFPEEQAILDRIEAEAEAASAAFNQFRWRQTVLGAEVTSSDKADLRLRLESLSDELDRYLASEYGVDLKSSDTYGAWRGSHQPFHWFVEFYGIMNTGGFDVIIGNPPYVEYRKNKSDYTVRGYDTESCGNLYAFVVERNTDLNGAVGRSGMIVPHSGICTDRMEAVQQLLLTTGFTWVSTYDIRPAKLFDGVDQRLCIYLTSTSGLCGGMYSSRYHRWNETRRSSLLQTVEYVDIKPLLYPNTFPKAHCTIETKLLKKLRSRPPLLRYLGKYADEKIYYHNAPRYWIRAMDFAPYFWNERDGEQLSTQVKTLNFPTKLDASAVVATLNSSLFYWWFLLLSDSRHLNLREIHNFPVGLDRMSVDIKTQLAELTEDLMESFRQHSRRRKTQYRVPF